MVTAGVLLVVVCALLASLIYAQAGGKVSVIVTARPVALGAMITADDLTTAQIASDSISAYAGAHMNAVVGKTAKVGIVKGEIISPAMVTDIPALPAGYAVVGVAVKPGQLPAEGLVAGDTVMVIILSTSQSATAAQSSGVPAVLIDSAPVLNTAAIVSSGGSVVSVRVPTNNAAQLAAASTAGLVALVKVASR